MKVKELYTDESKWVKAIDSIDKDKKTVNADSPAAVSWCLLAAIRKCYKMDNDTWELVLKKVMIAVQEKGYSFITTFNDHRNTTFNDVKQLVEKLDV